MSNRIESNLVCEEALVENEQKRAGKRQERVRAQVVVGKEACEGNNQEREREALWRYDYFL